MSIAAAYIYRDGRRDRPAPLEGTTPLAMAKDEFVWIGVVDPDEPELRRLQSLFGLHPLAVEDALIPHDLPKVDVYGDHLFIVTRTAFIDGEAIAYGETAIFMGRDHLITVRHSSVRGHTELREQLEAKPALLTHGTDYVLHSMLDFVVDGYRPVVEAIEEEVLDMEQRVLDAFLNREDLGRIFALRRELMRFRRLLGPMEHVAGRLEHVDTPCIDDQARPYFRDVLDHVRWVTSMVDSLREVLSWTLEASTLLEQQRQGVITRKLAAWAAILATPTAIAGIYGMNFEFMPELHWKYGYYAALGGILGLCGILYALFKRSNWL